MNRAFRCECSRDPHAGVRITVTAGPDAGWEIELEAGRHLVGRARHCAVVIDDPAVEANHVLLEIHDHGRVDVVQLAGRVPVATSRSYVELGDTRLDLVPPSPVAGLMIGLTLPDPMGGRLGGEPVVLDGDVMAVVDDHPELARGEAVVRSLRSQAAAQGLTTPAYVLTAPGDPALEGCPAILQMGARWRAHWTPDVSQPQHALRLHAAGTSQVFITSDARRSAIRQPSAVRTNVSANSPTVWRSLGTTPNVASGSSEREPDTISTTVVA